MDDYCIIYTNLGIITLGAIKCIKRTYNAVLAPSSDSNGPTIDNFVKIVLSNPTNIKTVYFNLTIRQFGGAFEI